MAKGSKGLRKFAYFGVVDRPGWSTSREYFYRFNPYHSHNIIARNSMHNPLSHALKEVLHLRNAISHVILRIPLYN
jgi:hypothetical protein